MKCYFHLPEYLADTDKNDFLPYLPEDCTCVIGNKDLEDHYQQALQGKARLFVECPETLPQLSLGEHCHSENLKVRPVVTSDLIPGLPELSIVTMHNFALRKVDSPVGNVILTASKVAGYRRAVFGLTEECYPVLFFHPESENILISTAIISNFRRGRFAPAKDWKLLAGFVLGFIHGDDQVHDVEFEMPVHPTYNADSVLPADAEKSAFRRCMDWFVRETIYWMHGNWGVLEGFSSLINENGIQTVQPGMRGDCMGETVLALAVDAALYKRPSAREMSEQLLKTLFTSGRISDINPASQTYGGLWFYENLAVVYGDDNSRAGFGAVFAGELLDWQSHTAEVIRMAYSLLRTTGPSGLRRPNVINPRSFTKGRTWKHYHEEIFEECRPHYQAYNWAFNLQMYALTEDEDFLISAKSALKRAAGLFPDYLWQNGASTDWARVLLPFAMLVEVEDTPENRANLKKVATYYIDKMNEFGVIPELMGKRELGRYPSPASNKDYGKQEAALVQNNGDPVCDMLYTINYGFIGMHEAYMATGDEEYKKACDRMADFLCRIQVSSQEQFMLDGCWMRGFDYSLWEYFGSTSDTGWGPWCVETGWTNSWIASALALRKLNRPLLSEKASDIYKALAPEVKAMMFTPLMPSTTSRGTHTIINTAFTGGFAEG